MTAPQDALIYSMVVMSAADRSMSDRELNTIGEIVRHLPVFQGFDLNRLPEVVGNCMAYLEDEDGLDTLIDAISEALPERLYETAYALACDIAAVDGTATQEELRLLEMMRHCLPVGRLPAAAIERGARARYMKPE
ncbi:MAG: tellurite resistance TerB family protein [Limibacillus sp.]